MQKVGQAGNDHIPGDSDRHIHPQSTTDAAGIVLEHAVQLIKIAQEIFSTLKVDHPVLRQQHAAGSAVQQAAAKVILQRLNLSRYATFRKAQRVGRTGKTLHDLLLS